MTTRRRQALVNRGSAHDRGVSALALAAALAASGLSAVLVGPATAGALNPQAGACPGSTGVTVVVDFQQLGGDVQVRCAEGAVSSGFDALVKAGFDRQSALRSPGFLCRIDGRPNDDPCVDPSPPDAFWSYWSAERGGSWRFSSKGGGNRTPAQGSIEGWSFSLNRSQATAPPPRSSTFAIPAAPAPAPAAPAAPAPQVVAPPAQVGAATTVAGSPGAASTTPLPSTTVPTDADPPVAPAPASTVAPEDSVPGDDDTGPETTDSDAGEAGDEQTSADELASSSVELAESGRSGPTSPLGTGLAVGTMALLGAGAVVVNRRRFRIAPATADQP